MNVTPSATPSNRLHFHCLALLAALTMAFVALPASASHPKQFRANFTTQFTSVVAFPIVHISVTGEGHALHMGRTTAVTTNQMVNLLTGAGTATYTLTAANGDTVVLEFVVATIFLPSGATFAGTYIVTGGTGRFAGATGSGSASGSATFTGPSNGVGSFAVDGTISY